MFKATQEQKIAANTYVIAQAYTQTIRPVLEKIQAEILEKFKYKWDLEKVGERLTDEYVKYHGEYCKRWFDTYLISDKDFSHCLTEYHARFTEKGFKVKEFGYCPLLVAESLERDAEKLLIDSMQPVTGLSFHTLICAKKEHKIKYVNLTMQLLAPYLKNTNK